MIYQDEFNEVTAYYNHAFLLGMDNDEQKQLKIKFNPKLSNLKRQLQETKIETIGSKFPFITRNGNVDYFSFSMGGLISYLADEQELFLNNRNKRFYGKDEEETYETDNSKNRFFFTNETNPSHTNIASERFFRELVEQFLTNGNYKIFKSPTEGIKIVSLLGVSLTPVETLGRMLYSFSSTANEVAEFNLNNAINYQIIQYKPFNTISNIITKMENGIYHVSQNSENVYNIIKNNLSQEQKFLKYLSSIQVEGNCTLTINSSINISVNEYFELKDVINITDLVVNTTSASAVIISYVAVYEEIITENEQLDLSLVAVSDFYQLTITSNWFIVNKEVDVFEKLEEELGVKIVNLKYAQIEVFQGQSPMIFYVNNSQKPLIIDGETSNILFDTKITDLKVVQDNYLAESVLTTNTNADMVTNEEEVIYTTEPISTEDNEIKLGYITVIYVGLVKSNA